MHATDDSELRWFFFYQTPVVLCAAALGVPLFVAEIAAESKTQQRFEAHIIRIQKGAV
jgi:hypothetical protein